MTMYDRSSGGHLPQALTPGRGFAPPVRAALVVACGWCLLTVGAKAQVPGPVPATLQTLALMAVASWSGSRLASATVAAYLAAGFLGLPVFAGPAAGPAYLLGPTGGFLLGMLPAAWLVGRAADHGAVKRASTLLPALLVASCLVFAAGLAWLATGAPVGGEAKIGLSRAWQIGGAPFIAVETVKILVASLLMPRLPHATRR